MSGTRRGRRGPSQSLCPGLLFHQLVWLFVIAAFLGDLIEMVFCRITMGWWMSRSSVVWGPFSVVGAWRRDAHRRPL